jgi:hypothetical protein
VLGWRVGVHALDAVPAEGSRYPWAHRWVTRHSTDTGDRGRAKEGRTYVTLRYPMSHFDTLCHTSLPHVTLRCHSARVSHFVSPCHDPWRNCSSGTQHTSQGLLLGCLARICSIIVKCVAACENMHMPLADDLRRAKTCKRHPASERSSCADPTAPVATAQNHSSLLKITQKQHQRHGS